MNVKVSMTDSVGGSTTRESSNRSTGDSHHMVVMPSSQLDSHLHSSAAEVTRKRHLQEQDRSFTDGDHDNDLMTPPAVLLKQEMKRAEQLACKVTQEVGVSSGLESLGDVEIVDCWIRCIALARIVYGDSHWVLAKTHIQLGKAYLDIQGLPKQALLHTAKGRDVLLSPECRVTYLDMPNEAKFQLAIAHCVMGQAHTLQGILRKAEQELLEAERVFGEQVSYDSPDVPATSSNDIGGGGSATHYQLQLDLSTARARLDLKREQFSSSKKHFVKSIDLTKCVFGPENGRLVPLLRGKATAEANLSLYGSAVQSLEDALTIAERHCGSESVVTAELLQARGRLGVAEMRGGTTSELATTEDVFSKASMILAALLGHKHKKTLVCKEELCSFLSFQSEYREKAIPLLKELIEDKKEALGELDAEVGHSLKLLASLLLERGKVAQATPLLKEANRVYSCSLGDKHKETLAVSDLLESLTSSTFHQKVNHWKL